MVGLGNPKPKTRFRVDEGSQGLHFRAQDPRLQGLLVCGGQRGLSPQGFRVSGLFRAL